MSMRTSKMRFFMCTIRLMGRRGRNEMLFSFSFLIFLLGASYSQIDRLIQGQVLKDGDQLVSAFGNFRMGFFSPEGTRNRDLGIWCHRTIERNLVDSIYQDSDCNIYNGVQYGVKKSLQPVWVANRNYSISDKSGKLVIDSTDGNLKILHSKGNPIVVTSFQAAGNTSATLEKNGNFVVYEMYSNGSRRELWQSFDYATDTNVLGDHRYFGEGITCSYSGEGFMPSEGIKLSKTGKITKNPRSAKCTNCFAFASTNTNNIIELFSGKESRIRDSFRMDFQPIYMEDLGPKTNAEKKNRRKKLIIGVVVALVVTLLFFLSYLIWRKYKAKEKWWKSLGIALVIPLLCYYSYLIGKKLKAKVESIWNRWKLLHELGDNVSVSLPIPFGKRNAQHKDQKNELKIFDFQIIAAATNNFSPENKLGQGGFGPVFKGQLLDGQEIAIKKLSKSSEQGIEEFKNEVKLIPKLQHTNLVRLLGCSLHGGERFLEYEYLPNKSLDFFLFDSNRNNLLNLKKRLSIIEGIAQGLVYLHKYSRLKVIHRDLKVSNILLDDQMNPKISDFGMARTFGMNEVEANTNRIVGTHGYMSPEYVLNGVVSMKTDVYSFGVMVLEIVSCKKNNGCYDSERPLNLVGYAWQLWNEGKGLELIEQTIDESCSPNQVLRYLNVGLLCAQDQARDRPTMSEVISMLTNETMILPAPKQPAFFITIASQEPQLPVNKFEICSANNVTISEMEGR